ncbi:hypothetical protein ACIQCF_23545 [Streptomyces sp. NPDC088353]|uniref:hypothetical protein n=1 Tax=unclassified Streptomyces TaxID=2593676 RepID=UPI003691EB13
MTFLLSTKCAPFARQDLLGPPVDGPRAGGGCRGADPCRLLGDKGLRAAEQYLNASGACPGDEPVTQHREQ